MHHMAQWHLAHGALRRFYEIAINNVEPRVAMETYPVAALGLEAVLHLPSVKQIIRIHHGRRRVYQVIVAERALIDRFRRPLKPEMPDL